jgi:hypothetical protein
MADCNISSTQSIKLLLFHTFCPNFLLFFFFLSIRSLSRRFNLQSYRGSYLSFIQTLLGQSRSSIVECWWCPWLPSESIKPNSSVCKIGGSDFPYFEQGLPVSIRFVWQHIFVTPLENQLLQSRQAWRVEIPGTMDPTLTRATSLSPHSTPWWSRVTRHSKRTVPILKSSSFRVVRWRDKGPFSRTLCRSSSTSPR